MTPVELVQACTLLNPLTAEDRERLLSAVQMRKAAKGEVIWLGGEPQGFFGMIGRGFVKLSRPSASGHEMAMELFGPGQVFGLNGVLTGRGCPLNATALTQVLYGYAPATIILGIYDRNVPFKDLLLRRAMGRLHEKLDLMSRMTSGKVEQRIAAILMILADSYGRTTADGILLEVPLTRQELGELAGTTTESAIRLMSRWQKEGLIATDNHAITLLDMAAIERIFEEA